MPKHKRVWRIVFLACMVLVAGAVSSAEFARRPVRFLIGFTPGGGTDQLARILSPRLSEKWGQPVVIENRPGADGDIALEMLMGAASDGHTLVFATNALTITPSLRSLKYDPINSFAPVTMAAAVPGVLTVRASLPVNTLKELIALAKAKPGALNGSTGSNGGSGHIAFELFKSMAGINVARVAYTNGAQEIADLLSGQMQMTFGTAVELSPHIKSGRLRAVAVSTAQPSALFPSLPTVAASGVPGYEYGSMTAVFAPAKTPAAIINRLSQEIARFLRTPEAKENLLSRGVEAVGSTPEELGNTVKSEIAKVRKLIKDTGIKVE